MSNTITLSAIYNRNLDELFSVNTRTSVLENGGLGIEWNGGREVKIPKLSMQGLGDVSGCEIPNGDYTFGYETKQLQWDRGRSFVIPRYAYNETNFTLTVSNVLVQFVKNQVIPEVDKLRLSTLATAAITAGNVVYEGSSVSSTPVADLLADIASVQDKIGEDKELFIFISTPKKAQLLKSSEITKYLGVREGGVNANVKIETFNDCPLIGVPSSYMKSAFDLNDGTTSGEEDGGVVPATGAKDLNWIICARGVATAVGYPRVEKLITADENQAGDCAKVMFRTYHGLFVLDNKVNGLLVNAQGAAPTTKASK